MRASLPLFLMLLGLAPVQAVQVVLSPSQDTVIYDDAGGALANGSGDYLFTGQNGFNGGSRAMRSLLIFELGGIPSDAVINSVSLELTAVTPNPFGNREINLHRLLGDWGEGASNADSGEAGGAASQTGDATWIHRFFTTESWTNPGGDFEATESATQIVGQDGAYVWSSAGLVADVQGFVDGGLDNFGWILIGEELQTAKRFHSGDGGDPGAPKLTIDYTPVPEPSVAVLMAGGLLLGARRRLAQA
ncbi:MAG: DNRLRE domain-containing protein [Verrucomicrobiota bacterium]